jgi:hypothetical protein
MQMDNEQYMSYERGVGMLSPPNLPGSRQQNITRTADSKGMDRKMVGMQGQDPVQITGQNKQHFMQDAIERKIEKFSS